MRVTINKHIPKDPRYDEYRWICDNCERDYHDVSELVTVKIDGETYHLCDECFMEKLGDFIASKYYDFPMKITVNVEG